MPPTKHNPAAYLKCPHQPLVPWGPNRKCTKPWARPEPQTRAQSLSGAWALVSLTLKWRRVSIAALQKSPGPTPAPVAPLTRALSGIWEVKGRGSGMEGRQQGADQHPGTTDQVLPDLTRTAPPGLPLLFHSFSCSFFHSGFFKPCQALGCPTLQFHL